MEMRPQDRMFIQPQMAVVDVVHSYPGTIEVFRSYDEQAGECLCCMALFDSIAEVAEKYHLDLFQVLSRLESAANSGTPGAQQTESDHAD